MFVTSNQSKYFVFFYKISNIQYFTDNFVLVLTKIAYRYIIYVITLWDGRIISCLCKIKIIINHIAIFNISNPSRAAASIINRYEPIFYIYLPFNIFQS